MSTPKALLNKRAAALKLRLKKSAAIQEQLRLDHEQSAREAAELEAALEVQPDAAPVQDPIVEESPVVLPRSLWQRFMDTF